MAGRSREVWNESGDGECGRGNAGVDGRLVRILVLEG
jgi:hypothetical protein